VKARFQSAHGQERVDEEEPGEDEDEFVADLETTNRGGDHQYDVGSWRLEHLVYCTGAR
jgi:hypothetical protein